MRRQLLKMHEMRCESITHLVVISSFQMRKQAQRRKAFTQGCIASSDIGISPAVLNFLPLRRVMGLILALPLPGCVTLGSSLYSQPTGK